MTNAKKNRKGFLSKLDNSINHFEDSNYEHVISISHNDADGFSCSAIIQNLIYKMNIPIEYHIFNLATSWKIYLKSFYPKLSKNKRTAFILTDIGSNISEIAQIVQKRKEDYYILDHHEVNKNIDDLEIPQNLFVINPTLYGFDGLSDIAGASLTYLFARKIKPSIAKLGWLAILGIAGDSLKSMDQLTSFNKEVYEEILNEEVIEEFDGLTLFGGMHEKIKEGLRSSILPYLKDIGGDLQKSKLLLRKLKINENTPVIELNQEEIESLQEATKENVVGKSAILPKKSGILKFAFEHAILLNILGFNNINIAFNIILSPNINLYAKKMYYDYIKHLIRDLNAISKIRKIVTEHAIIINAGGKISPSNWSDLASFSTVNEVLNPEKVLFLGGEEQRYHMIKLSVRCNHKYLEKHPGKGVNYIIENIKKELGGIGGGHKLAGGIKISQNSFNILKENIDTYT